MIEALIIGASVGILIRMARWTHLMNKESK
jgi:hypothetical protein